MKGVIKGVFRWRFYIVEGPKILDSHPSIELALKNVWAILRFRSENALMIKKPSSYLEFYQSQSELMILKGRLEPDPTFILSREQKEDAYAQV